MELADTSAWLASRRDPELRAAFDARLLDGAIATSAVVTLELVRRVREPSERRRRRAQLERLVQCPIGPDEWSRALDVLEELIDDPHSQGSPVAARHLLVAAAAESAQVPVLHSHDDFERIVAVTGQAATRLTSP